MKLHAQYSKATITSSIIVLLIAGFGYFFLLRYVLKEQLDGTLKVEEVEIQDYVKKKNTLPEATTYKDQRIRFEKTEAPVKRNFSSLTIYDKGENEYELSRQLVFPLTVGDNYYAAFVSKSQEETESLIWIILLTTLGLILLSGLIIFFYNRFLLRKLWRPFYSILGSIKNFNLNAPSPIQIQKTSIEEFNQMTDSVNIMIGKVIRDYISLKNFTDQASHELQTPLAVVNSKLDVLIQDQQLGESSHRQIQSIYNAVEKMSKICQSLLLLSKIENDQFNNKEQVDMKKEIETRLFELEEWIKTDSLAIITELLPTIISINPQLADILISNLVINAIKYSGEKKEIMIRLEKNSFLISNSGTRELDARLIFDRFWKSDYSDGSGLGLAIVKQICEKYGFGLSYEFKDNRHLFRINF
jgi:signal transduction histidine kinase